MCLAFCCGAICPPRKDYSTFFCCLPLALGVIFIAAFVIWSGAWDIYLAVISTYFPDPFAIMTLIYGSLKVMFGVFAIVGIALKNGPMVHANICVFYIMIILFAIFFAIQWVGWIIDMTAEPPWIPNTAEIVLMTVYSLCAVMAFICAYWIMSLFASCAAILEVGGSGWERLTYQQILDQDSDLESGVGKSLSGTMANRSASKTSGPESEKSAMASEMSELDSLSGIA
eukprot:Selendium_serpulae@DN2480_c0_g1_i1.p1